MSYGSETSLMKEKQAPQLTSFVEHVDGLPLYPQTNQDHRHVKTRELEKAIARVRAIFREDSPVRSSYDDFEELLNDCCEMDPNDYAGDEDRREYDKYVGRYGTFLREVMPSKFLDHYRQHEQEESYCNAGGAFHIMKMV